jgi:hypothetical protein
VHNTDSIAESLRHVADTMQRMETIMRNSAGFGDSIHGKLLLQHAEEMQGASEICIDWIENLKMSRKEMHNGK